MAVVYECHKAREAWRFIQFLDSLYDDMFMRAKCTDNSHADG